MDHQEIQSDSQFQQTEEKHEDYIYSPIGEQLNYFNLQHYRLEKMIGFSNHQVHLYTTKNPKLPQQIAVKTIEEPQEQKERLTLNFSLMNMYKVQSTNHPNIVQIYGFCQIVQYLADGTDQQLYLIVMEYIPYNLKDRIEIIQQNQTPATLEEFLNTINSLTNASAYFQDLGQCHCDLKPENILIDSLNNPTIYKLCDLDNLSYFAKGSRYQSYNITTFVYQPPEIKDALRQGLEQIQFNAFKSDIYSMGLCLIQLHNKASINDRDFGTLKWISNVLKLFENDYGAFLTTLISMILEFKNNQRPDFLTLKSLLNHEIKIGVIQFDSILKISNQFQERVQSSAQESVGTIDMNYLPKQLIKRNKYDINIESFKTLSSDNSQGFSINVTPKAKYNQTILSNFAKQAQDSKKISEELKCSIEEVLDEGDSPYRPQDYLTKKIKNRSIFYKTVNQNQQQLLIANQDGISENWGSEQDNQESDKTNLISPTLSIQEFNSEALIQSPFQKQIVQKNSFSEVRIHDINEI